MDGRTPSVYNGKKRSGITELMRMRPLPSLCLPLFFMVLPAFFCTDDYNPFTDVHNAQAYLVTGFSEGDTVDIFSTETVDVALAVKELIDTFSLHAGANRYFSDTVIARDSRGWPTGRSGRYFISFYDTGWQEISCITRRSDGEVAVQRRSCYARSPLRQAPLVDTLGAMVCLSTVPVRDRDVMYSWSFGEGMVVQSVPHIICREIPVNAVSTVGQLWVTELNGSYASPRTPFVYAVFDNQGPEITCVKHRIHERCTRRSV